MFQVASAQRLTLQLRTTAIELRSERSYPRLYSTLTYKASKTTTTNYESIESQQTITFSKTTSYTTTTTNEGSLQLYSPPKRPGTTRITTRATICSTYTTHNTDFRTWKPHQLSQQREAQLTKNTLIRDIRLHTSPHTWTTLLLRNLQSIHNPQPA